MKPKDGTLEAKWGKIDGDSDITYLYGKGVPKGDANMLHDTFSQGLFYMEAKNGDSRYVKEEKSSLFEELERRGYDLTTFRFSIKKKQQGNK